MIGYKLALGMVAFGSILGATAQLLFKISISPLNIFKLGIGFVLYGIAFLIYLLALKSLPLSVAYPFVAFSYPLVALLSWYYLNESFTTSKVIGTIGLVICIWLIAK